VLLQVTELDNVMLNVEEDKMFYVVVSANEIFLFLELLSLVAVTKNPKWTWSCGSYQSDYCWWQIPKDFAL